MMSLDVQILSMMCLESTQVYVCSWQLNIYLQQTGEWCDLRYGFVAL